MIVQPRVRGFICTAAHPTGCAKIVQREIDYVRSQAPIPCPKRILIVGASMGYGLACRIAATFGANAQTIGVIFDRQASGKRTASAGWYNTAAFEEAAHAEGHYAKTINGDAYSDEIKQQVCDLIRQDWGQVDLVIHSLAAPKRTEPKTGTVHTSVLKPLGQTYTNKTINAMTGEVKEISLEPANEAETAATVAVMGGADWTLWIEKLMSENLLAEQAKTIAFSYIGPALTHPIYTGGTIGQAKKDLHETAERLDEKLKAIGGEACISVNRALVTQASSAIPVVPLYLSILFKLMKAQGTNEGCIEQMVRMFKTDLYSTDRKPRDEDNRIRLDDWELEPELQKQILDVWDQVNTDNVEQLTDLAGYRHYFYELFGFEQEGIDYDADVDVDVVIPSLRDTVPAE